MSSFIENRFYLVSNFEAFGSSKLNLTGMRGSRRREQKFTCTQSTSRYLFGVYSSTNHLPQMMENNKTGRTRTVACISTCFVRALSWVLWVCSLIWCISPGWRCYQLHSTWEKTEAQWGDLLKVTSVMRERGRVKLQMPLLLHCAPGGCPGRVSAGLHLRSRHWRLADR